MIPLKLPTGQRVGEIRGDVAVLWVTSRHYLAIGKGYSIDANVLRSIVTAGCHWIEFQNMRSGKRFRLTVDEFEQNKKSFEWNHGVKYAAPDSLYKVVAPTNPGLSNLYA